MCAVLKLPKPLMVFIKNEMDPFDLNCFFKKISPILMQQEINIDIVSSDFECVAMLMSRYKHLNTEHIFPILNQSLTVRPARLINRY